MIYMLDTDSFSYIMRHHALSVVEQLEAKAKAGETLCISVITYQELRYGAERRGSKRYHLLIDRILERLDFIADWTPECADHFAVLYSGLQALGKPISYTDTMIAAHALTLDATLVSNNQKHFKRVKNLKLVNWI